MPRFLTSVLNMLFTSRFWSMLAALLLVGFARTACAQTGAARAAADAKEVQRMSLLHPHAVPLLTAGEAAFASGDAKRALTLFEQAAAEAPESVLLMRRRCQALSELGRRSDALDACQKAITSSTHGAALALRAEVGALMSDTPTTDELALALIYARQAALKMPDQPWGYAARCDIAYRIGDLSMLDACQHDLAQIAPDHYETRRAAGLRVARMPAALRWGWLAFFSFVAYTLVHALRRRRASRASARALERASSALVVIALALLPAWARAADGVPTPKEAAPAGGLSQWPVNREDPVSSVPTPAQRDSNPIEYGYHVMDLSDLGSAAAKRGDYAAAAKFYEASVKAVPDVAVGYRKACEFDRKAGNAARALQFCRGALGVEGVQVNDYLAYSDLVFGQPGELTSDQLRDLESILEHLKTVPNAEPAAAQVECELALRASDTRRLERCTQVLTKAAPNAAKTISFRWALALREGDISEAQKLVAAAKQTPMDPKGIQTMERATAEEARLPRRLRRHWALFGITLGLGVFGLVRFMSGSKRRAKLSAA